MRPHIFATVLLFCCSAEAQPLAVSEGPAVSVSISSVKTHYAEHSENGFIFRFSPSAVLRNLSSQTIAIPETDEGALALVDIRILDTEEQEAKIVRTVKQLPSFRGQDLLPSGIVRPYDLPTEFDIRVKKTGTYRIILTVGITGKTSRQIRWLASEPFEVSVETKLQR